MSRFTLVLVAVLAASCADPQSPLRPDDRRDPPATDSGDPIINCPITLSDPVPADQADDVFVYAPLEWRFSEIDPTATVELFAGSTETAPLPGSSTWREDTLVWAPAAPLQPSTLYTYGLFFCEGTQLVTGSFTTSSTGEPVAGAEVAGVYGVDLTEGRILEPPGVSALLQQQLDARFLLDLTAVEPPSLSLELARADPDSCTPSQHPCAPTHLLNPAPFDANPWFASEASELVFEVQGVPLTVLDVAISGAFAPDGNRLDGLEVRALLDTRSDAPGSDVCQLVSDFGLTCAPCPDGVVACLELHVDQVYAPRVDVPVTSITPAEVASNPGCDP